MDEQGRKEFGAYLKQLRTGRGLTQKDAAHGAGISNPYLAQLERGQRNPPSRNILARLAEMYGVTSQELWGRAEYAEGRSGQKYNLSVLAHEIVERVNEAFQMACADPKFSFGNSAVGKQLDFETKAFIVELYEKNTGKRLLTDQEAAQLHFRGQEERREDGEAGGDGEGA